MKKINFIVLLFALLSIASIAKADTLFTKDLYFGMQGDPEINKLQEFLTEKGMYSGPITGNFYSLTLKAVKDFQTQEGISPTSGYFGPKTRTKLNDLLGSQIQDSENQAISETGTTTPPVEKQKITNDVVASIQQQIQLLLQQVELLKQQQTAQQQTNQSIQNLQSSINQQTQIIQQQVPNQTTNPTQTTQTITPQETTVSNNATVITPAISTINISKIDDSSFQIINNGPNNIRIGRLVFSGVSEPNNYLQLGDSQLPVYYENNGQKYNRLSCTGVGSLGIFSEYGNPNYDPCSNSINELKPSMALKIRSSLPLSSALKSLIHVNNEIIDISNNSDISFNEVTF